MHKYLPRLLLYHGQQVIDHLTGTPSNHLLPNGRSKFPTTEINAATATTVSKVISTLVLLNYII
ncbi:hypothetical protein [uncultured Lactobacillus sp.]|uniref:hypothetical protein n=1 Tax=uncultured Lactobacillus sp. TaxID=153152 RepID=UPI00259BA977|nr:hypothetical protein [uncultured Lactobacillus sp.]